MKLVQALILALVVSQVTADPLQLFSATTVLGSTGSLSGSLLGGQTIYISGIGFPSNPSLLQVLVGGIPCIIPADGLTPTTVSCVTTASSSLTDKTNQLIQVVSNQQIYTLAGFSYSYAAAQTPYLYQVFPLSQIGGNLLHYYGIHRVNNQGDGLRDMGDFIGLYTGNSLCSMFDITQNQITFNTYTRVMCHQASQQEAGKYNVSEHVTVGWAQTLWTMQRASLKAEYYQHTVLPAVANLNPNQGGLAGQDLVISGSGFSNNPNNISVTVDGVNCAVKSSTQTSINCRLEAKQPSNSAALSSSSATPLQNYLAGVGLKYWRYNTANLAVQNINGFRTAVNSNSTQISMVESGFSATLNTKDIYGSYYGQVFKGYFYAPVTGNYIFRGAADDQFAMYISSQSGTTDPASLNAQISSNWATSSDYNYYIANMSSALGNPHAFEAGKYYYLQVYHLNTAGSGWMKISVQVPNTNTALPRKRYQVNQISTTFTNQPQIMQFSLNNAAGGTFNLSYYQVDSKTLAVLYNQMVTINYNANCTQFQNALNSIVLYSGYGVTCTDLQITDNTGMPATPTTGTYFTWTVNISLLRPAAYTSATLTFKGNNIVPPTGKTVSFLQNRLQVHCPLIAGTFTMSVGGTPVKVWNSATNSYSTTTIPFNVTAINLQNALNQLPGFGKVEVNLMGDPYYGATWLISYIQYTGDVPNLILSGAKLTGGATGTLPQISFWETRPYSPNIIFNPVDQNFLFMPASTPNVLVTVNGIPSVCLESCGYTFLAGVPQVSAQSLSGSIVSLSIANPTSITYTTSQLTVTLDGQPCTILPSGSLSSFQCQMPTNSDSSPIIRAGQYNCTVKLADIGLLNFQDTVHSINYGLALNTVNANSGGMNGGYIIQLIGNGYPNDAAQVTVNMCGTNVTVNYISNTLTNITVPKCATSGLQTITYYYNGLTATGQFTYTAPPTSADIFSIVPQSANPTLKAVMTITGQGFGTDLNAITVYLKNNGNGLDYNMRVLSVNDSTIKCGIPGGLPGHFQVVVSKQGYGQISPSNSTATAFTYQLSVTSISPASGAYYGGTLITISGINFATDILQTLVYVSDTMNWLCDVKSVSNTSITCRTPPANPAWSSNSQGIVVGNRLILDSDCPSGNCNFTYNDQASSPSLTTISSQLATANTNITLSGSNLNLNNNGKIILTNNVSNLQTEVNPILISSTSVTFTVPNIQSGHYIVCIRLDPIGQSNYLSLDIGSIVNTLTQYGSIMGMVLQIKGYGLPNIYPFDNTYSIRIVSNSIYYDAIINSTSSSNLQLIIPNGYANQVYTITLTNPIKQVFNIKLTLLASTTPIITLLQPLTNTTISPGVQQIRLNRTNLATANPTAIYLYNILNATANVSISSWTYNGTNIVFSYGFDCGQYGVMLYYAAYGWANATTVLINVVPPTNYTAAHVDVSYAGGQLTVAGTNINSNAIIRVGGFAGKAVSVNTTHAVFSVPALFTPLTVSTYPSLSGSQLLTAANIISDSNTNNNNVYAFDNKDSTYYSSSSNGSCYIGIDVGSGKLANVNRIRFFPYYKWTIAANYLVDAVFEASTDGLTYTTIATVDNTVHAGWNSLKVSSTNNYRYFRFAHNSTSECKLSSLQFHGTLYNDLSLTNSNIASFAVSPVFFDGYNTFTFTNALTYSTVNTPVVNTVSPSTGSIYGNQIITITGINLNFDTPTVLIDTMPCVVNSANNTVILCTTGARLFLPKQNTFKVHVGHNVATINQKFEYVMRWSDIRTWGTDLPPVEGDLVYVPQGMTLLVDQDTPILAGIVVENGKLIFADEKDMIISTYLITLNGGEFRAGTEDKPYQHKLTFVMYGSYYGKQQPMFGNKGIGCMNCKFSMYGIPRPYTWSVITSTIAINSSTLTVRDPVDWQVGEQIVVASTDFDHNQAEQRTITAITGSTITVDRPFNYKHFSGVQTYSNGDAIQMRAEVGLLSRNIRMMGDPTSAAGEYGSHLMLTGSAQSGLVGHVAYSQFTHCGQPRIMGRYCIHFHMAGDVSDSYVLGNAVHHSFARVVTLHGVKFLTVSHNVGYRVKGHNFFVQDGIETHNLIQYNLAISSLSSSNMMQTDISVASFWVTNPTNHLRFNHAAGGDFYGFWYEIKPHPDGPSATLDICPIGNPLGESHDNVAHSYVRFGLRIFKLYSRKYPCGNYRDDSYADPWSMNPSIQSVFYNYVMYKNGESGLLAERTGNVLFQNFTIAQSVKSAGEFFLTNFTKQVVQARNWTVIGVTNMDPAPQKSISKSVGIIGPRSSGFKISNIRYHNFGVNTTALQTCSGCDPNLVFINTAAQYLSQKIQYYNVSGKYLHMNGLKRQIIYDLDGSLSKSFNSLSRPSGTIVANFKHLADDNACTPANVPSVWDNALVCDETAQVRRVMFTNLASMPLFASTPMKVQLIPDVTYTVADNSTSFQEIYSIDSSRMEPMIALPRSYAVAYIGGRTYNIWWLTGLDFSHLAMQVSTFYTDADPAIVFKFNYTANRQLYEVATYFNGGIQSNYTTPTYNTTLDHATCEVGDYTHDNDAGNRTFTLCASSRGKMRTYQYTDVNAIYCRYLCPAPNPSGYVKETFVRMWSNATQWPGGYVPKDYEDVTIPGEWTILVDIQPSIMGYWLIKGDVIVPSSNSAVHFKANNIWIQTGSLQAGISTAAYTGSIIIQIYGNKNDSGIVIDPLVVGNKMFVVTGSLLLYGVVPTTTWTKLTAMARPGDTTITVGSTAGWKVGDKLSIGASFRFGRQSQQVTITAINGNSVDFSPALKYKHYGDASPTISNSIGTLDTRAAVGHLTRNIQIIAGDDSGWGYNLLVYGFNYVDSNGTSTLFTGNAVLHGVEFIKGGQYDTENPALKLYNTIGSEPIEIYGSTFHACSAYCLDIDNINNAKITYNVFSQGRTFLVRANNLNSYTFQNNLMINAMKRSTLSQIAMQLVACYATYTSLHNIVSSIKHNLCQGSDVHGFILPYYPCSYVGQHSYDDNTVGSAQVGYVFNRVGSTCLAASGVRAYACRIGHIASSPNTVQTRYENFMVADSLRGVTLRFGHEGDDNTAYFKNSYISAISRPNCSQCYGGSAIPCTDMQAVRMLAVTINGQSLPMIFGTGFDVICKQQSFDSKAFLDNITFQNYNINYKELPQCSNNAIFQPHDLASDITGSHHLTNVSCKNCSVDALARFTPPNPSQLTWFGGCGDLLCTGKNNYIITDYTGTLLGFPGTLIANNSQIGENTDNCTFNSHINGYICRRLDFGVLQYENIAPDFNTRIMWPVYLKYDGGKWNTTTNAWKQWDWEGNQPQNHRLGRFVSVIQVNQIYNMTFQSQPPIDMRLQFQRRTLSGNNSQYIVVKLYHPVPNSIRVQVKDVDQPIAPIPLVNNANPKLNLTQCGSNIFFYQNYTIHFVITADYNCQVRVSLINSIQLTARFSMDINNFYAMNGQTLFIDRMCAVLGILDTSRLKIVGIYNGSVTIHAYIDQLMNTTTANSSANNNTAQKQQIKQIYQKLTDLYTNGQINTKLASAGFGPLLDLQSSAYYITPDIIPDTQTNQQNGKLKTQLIVGLCVGITFVVVGIIIGIMYVKRTKGRVTDSQIHPTDVKIQEQTTQMYAIDTVSDDK